MVSGAPDFWLKGKYIELIDRISRIDRIVSIDQLGLIDLITKIEGIDTIDVVNAIRTIDTINAITEIKKISSFGQTGTLTYINEVATADILTPTKDYRTRVLGAVIYNPTDIQAYLRWKNTGNFVLGVPTIGLVGMNPMGLRHPLGAADEVLELYMSAGGTVKGWVVTEEQYSVGTPHTKTVTELLGLLDSYAAEHESPPSDWFSPTGFEDPDNGWVGETNCYDTDEGTYADSWWGGGTDSKFIVFTFPASAASKVKFKISDDSGDITLIDIDVYDGSWHHAYSGEFNGNVWDEKLFTSRTITKIRFSLYSPTHAVVCWFYELYVWGT